VGAVVDALLQSPSATVGASSIPIFLMENKNFKQRLQRMPDGAESAHMRIYRVVTDGEGSATHLKILDSNQNEVLPLILENGGTVYLPFCPLLNEEQREQHFGDQIAFLNRMKRRYDPNSILGMSAGLFAWAGPGPACGSNQTAS
jgi:hypothetical protein